MSIYRQKYLILFMTSQCSWCRKFYTNEPFKCPYNTLHSNCAAFDELIEVIGWWTREDGCKKYEQRIFDMMQQVETKEIMTKCRDSKCGALNPNPQKPICWKCKKDTFHCPVHKSLVLRYNIEENYWKCSLVSDSQKYYEI